ncbi:cyclic nucleotide-binding domain-containing protein [Haematococcus lacustris]|uniref:Cyclic nucleotide-binding domain-containing protein n=1 Tax=Haematococcus lacustris TaxID=44745 RepID=A0A699Z5U0_HAELA|nr:cyclic nucleotide-binding domain-containing protein [Haematococcus lacustris]
MGKAGNGLVEGSSAVPIPYQGSSLYVRGGFPQEHELMLGDEDDPDRPLTRWDKLYLLAFGLINPEGRTKWDMFILLLLLWVCFASPLIICFGLGMGLHTGGTDRVVLIIELVVDGCFVLDILLNFRTAYLDSVGNLVSDRRRIARHYMRSWFVLDLVSVVPFDILTEGALSFLSMLKLLRVMRVGKVVRMMRVYRLLRVSRLPRILEKVEQYLDKGILQLAMFALSVGLLAHLSACIFHYMSLLTFYLEDSWAGTWVEAQGLVGADLAHRYLNSLYWAFTTVATVGYGDITPKNQKEKVLAIFVMCR